MRTGVNNGSGLVTITYTATAPTASALPEQTVKGAAPPLAPSEPDNAFAFAPVRVGLHQLRLGFDYPGRGTLDVLVTTRRPGAASAARLRPGPRRVRLGRLHDSAESPQTKTLRVPLSHRAKAILARRGRLPIRLSLVFAPEGGRSSRQAHKYTVRPAR